MGLTAERLREVLDYDLETGVFKWRYRPEKRVQWNGRFANKAAGSVDPDTGYWRIRIGDKLYYSHRLAFLYVLGNWPRHEVDHKNLERNDCRWNNLREATHSQNGLNKKIDPSRNRSGFKGVSLDRRSGKWVAEATIGGRRYRKWGFSSAELAYSHYSEVMQKHSDGFAVVSHD